MLVPSLKGMGRLFGEVTELPLVRAAQFGWMRERQGDPRSGDCRITGREEVSEQLAGLEVPAGSRETEASSGPGQAL